MSTPSRTWHAAVLAVCALVVTYALVVASRLLVGLFVAAVVYLLAWLLQQAADDRPFGSFSPLRAAATGTLVTVVVLYALVIAGQILLGVVVALTVVLVAWVTNPDGPVADYFAGSGG